MAPRQVLQDLLKTFGSAAVYFQEPSADKMLYPCIIYGLDSVDATFADNKPYTQTNRYLVTVIDRNPDSLLPGKVSSLPMSAFSRRFVKDGLYHSSYNLFF